MLKCDMLILEPMGNMLSASYDVEVFKSRLNYITQCYVPMGKPVVLMTCHRFLGTKSHTDGVQYEAYIKAMTDIYEKYKNQNTYFIDENEIMDEYTMLCADLTHPTNYGHFVMGTRIADKLREEFKII